MVFVGGAVGGQAYALAVMRSFIGPILGGYLSDPVVVKPITDALPFLRSVALRFRGEV